MSEKQGDKGDAVETHGMTVQRSDEYRTQVTMPTICGVVVGSIVRSEKTAPVEARRIIT